MRSEPRLGTTSKIVRAIMHVSGMSGLADALKEIGEIDRDALARIDRLPQRVSDALMVAEAQDYRIQDADAEAAVARLEDLLSGMDRDMIIRSSMRGPTFLTEYLLQHGGREASRALESPDARRYFRAILDRASFAITEFVLETGYDGRPERLALGDTLEALARMEMNLDRVSKALLHVINSDDADPEQYRLFGLTYVQRIRELLDYLEIPGAELRGVRKRYQLLANYAPLRLQDSHGRTHIVNSHRWLTALKKPTVVVGSPGSGKTTLTKLFMVGLAEDAEQSFVSRGDTCIPLLVKLRSEKLLPPQVSEIGARVLSTLIETAPDGWHSTLFEAGAAALIVDGYDEIASEDRRLVSAWLNSLHAQHPAIPIILTSRPGAVQSDGEHLASWDVMQVLPLNRLQVREQVLNWHRTVGLNEFESEVEAVREAVSFLSRVSESKSLQELCESPLLLATLCGLAASKNGAVASKRAELYEQFISMMAHGRDYERRLTFPIPGLSAKQVIGILESIAWSFQELGTDELPAKEVLPGVRAYQATSNDEAIASVRPGLLLDHLIERTGILRGIPVDLIDWHHKSFKEYLVAEYVLHNEKDQELLERSHLAFWQEVLGWAIERAEGANRTSALVIRALQSETGAHASVRQVILTSASRALALTEEAKHLCAVEVRLLLRSFGLDQVHPLVVELGDGAVTPLTKELTRSHDRSLLVEYLLAINSDVSRTALSKLGPEQLSEFASLLGEAYERTASTDLARRILPLAERSTAPVRLSLTGPEFADSLGMLGPSWRVVTWDVDSPKIESLEVLTAPALGIGHLDASSLPLQAALDILSRLGEVEEVSLTVRHGDGPDEHHRSLEFPAVMRLDLSGSHPFALSDFGKYPNLNEAHFHGAATGQLSTLCRKLDKLTIQTMDGLLIDVKVRNLTISEWKDWDLRKAENIAGLEELRLEDSPYLASLQGLPWGLARLYVEDGRGLVGLKWEEIDQLGIEELRFKYPPYLGVDVSPDQLAVMGLDVLEVGFGAEEVPELIWNRWEEADLETITDEELVSRGWIDWTTWEQIKGDADEWGTGATDTPETLDDEIREAGGFSILYEHELARHQSTVLEEPPTEHHPGYGSNEPDDRADPA